MDLNQCEAALRRVASRGRQVLDLPGYQVYFAGAATSPHLSLAVPVDDEAVTSRAIGALKTAFAENRSSARLEFMAELHPSLADALVEAGFRLDRRDPVMTCRPEDLFVPSLPSGATFEIVGAAGSAVAELLMVQAVAFTLSATDGGWEPILTDGLADGSFLAGLARRNGLPISAATLLASDGVGELAGVGTLPGYRKQGAAAAVSGRLLALAFSRGLRLAWLSADRSGARVYSRLGFQAVGTQLNFEATASPSELAPGGSGR